VMTVPRLLKRPRVFGKVAIMSGRKWAQPTPRTLSRPSHPGLRKVAVVKCGCSVLWTQSKG
jgi:hypothetical protein